MTDDELRAIEARLTFPISTVRGDTGGYYISAEWGEWADDQLNKLTKEVRSLRVLIKRASDRCLGDTGWCPFCDGHHDTDASRANCPAFTPSGDVR